MTRTRTGGTWLSQEPNGYWYVTWYNPETRRTERRSLRTRDRTVAEARMSSAVAAPGSAETLAAAWRAHARRLCKRAKTNAKQKGRPFALTVADVLALAERQHYRCAVSRLPFSLTDERRNPWAPSLDQIHPGEGYVPANVRLVLLLVNTAMNNWGAGTVMHFVWACARWSEFDPSEHPANRIDRANAPFSPRSQRPTSLSN